MQWGIVMNFIRENGDWKDNARRLVWVFIFIIEIVLTACSGEPPTKEVSKKLIEPSVLKIAYADETDPQATLQRRMQEAVRQFMLLKAKACNENKFSLLTSLLKKDSSIYTIFELETQYLNHTGVVQNVMDVDIQSVTATSEEGQYKIICAESVDIKYPGAQFVLHHYKWILTAQVMGEGQQDIVFTDITGKTVPDYEFDTVPVIPSIIPKLQKNDKYVMYQQAVKSMEQFIQIDFEKAPLAVDSGCGFGYGYGLNKLLAGFYDRRKKILEQKITRKILMKELFRSENNSPKGVVGVKFRVETRLGGVSQISDIELLVLMQSTGSESWKVYDIPKLMTMQF